MGPRQDPGGGPGGEVPETLTILHFGVPKIGKKTLTFTAYLLRIQRKIYVIYRLTGEDMKILADFTFFRL